MYTSHRCSCNYQQSSNSVCLVSKAYFAMYVFRKSVPSNSASLPNEWFWANWSYFTTTN